MLVPDTAEVLRYLGAAGEPDPLLLRQAEEAGAALARTLQPRYTWRVCALEESPEGIRFTGTALVLPGRDARTMLARCGRGILLACTLGARFDASLLALQARDMAKAALWDACGSALVERGCDAAEQELAERFSELYLTDRFSPGYGDTPLEVQPDLLAALDAERRLGITVSQSLLMHPVKSVTAVIGLSERPQPARIRGCEYCRLREHCTLRKGGMTCVK